MTIPTEDRPFRAQFNPWIGVAFIALGLFLFIWTLKDMLASGGFSVRLIIGLVFIAIGGLYLKRPYFAIAPNRLTVYTFFGQIDRRYPFLNFSDIEIAGSKVYIREEGRKAPTKINRWVAKPADWKKLRQLADPSQN